MKNFFLSNSINNTQSALDLFIQDTYKKNFLSEKWIKITTNNNEIFFFSLKLQKSQLQKFLFLKSFKNKLQMFVQTIQAKNLLTDINFSLSFFTTMHLLQEFNFNLIELELWGLNYWYCKLINNLILDLGNSHFQIYFYQYKNCFISLKKKKQKKFLLIDFNKTSFFSKSGFFRFRLRATGPYKLKGFQFLNEWIKLKQGKKPFK